MNGELRSAARTILIRGHIPDVPVPTIDINLLADKIHAIRELDEPQLTEQVMDQPRLIEFLLWLQAKGMQPGLVQFTRELLLQFPNWIGTATSLRLGDREIYRIDECAAIWNEMRTNSFGLTEDEESLLAVISDPTDEAAAQLAAIYPESSNGESLMSLVAIKLLITPPAIGHDANDPFARYKAWIDGITKKVTPEAVWIACAQAAMEALPKFFARLCNERSASMGDDDIRPLLQQIRAAFEATGEKKMFSRSLVAKIACRQLDERDLAHRLRAIGIAPGTVRLGKSTAKGYHLEHFTDAFRRFGIGAGDKDASAWPFHEVWCFRDAIAAAVAMMDRDADLQSSGNKLLEHVSRELEFTWSERVPRCFIGEASPNLLTAFSAKAKTQSGRWRLVTVPTESSDRDFWAAHADAYGITYDTNISCERLRRTVEHVARQTGLGILYQRAHLLIPHKPKATPRRLNWIRGLIDRGVPCGFLATPPRVEEFMKGGARQMEQWLSMPPCVRIGTKLAADDLLNLAVAHFPDFDRDLLEVIMARAVRGEKIAPHPAALKSLTLIAQRARFLASQEDKPLHLRHVDEATRDMLPQVSPQRVDDNAPTPSLRGVSERLKEPIKAAEFTQVDRNSADVLTKQLSAA